MSINTTTSKDGTVIAYDRAGDGPAVVLVHPAFGHRAGSPEFAGLAQLLAASGYSVYTYDRRGRGESGDTQPYAVERETEDLDAMIAAAGGSGGHLRDVLGRGAGALGCKPRSADHIAGAVRAPLYRRRQPPSDAGRCAVEAGVPLRGWAAR